MSNIFPGFISVQQAVGSWLQKLINLHKISLFKILSDENEPFYKENV